MLFITKPLRVLRSNKGQSIVELAILLPVLLMLLFGTIEFGRIYGTYMIISNASREGARVAAVGGSTTQIQNAVIGTAPTLNVGSMTIVVSKSGAGNRGDTVMVTIGYDIAIIAPLIGVVVDNPMHLESQMQMRIE